MRDRNYGQHPITTLEHCQISRSCKHPIGRNQNYNITSKWKIQDTNNRRHILEI